VKLWVFAKGYSPCEITEECLVFPKISFLAIKFLKIDKLNNIV